MKIELTVLTFKDLRNGDRFIKLPEVNNGHGGEEFDGSCDLCLKVKNLPLDVVNLNTGDVLTCHPDTPVIKIKR